VSNLAQRAAIASVAAAIFLGLLKGWAAWMTGSVAVLASLADSVLDLFASLVTLGGVRWAAQPADKEHRFGHGKAEALAALFQVVVISVSAFAILVRAIEQFMAGGATEAPEFGIGVSLVAIFITLALTRYQAMVVSRTGSIAITTDRVHYMSDLLLNGAVIAALLLDAVVGLRGADALFGVAIAFWLFFGAWKASEAALDQLMDREWPDEKRRRLVEIASGHPQLKGLHDLRTRTSGSSDFAQFHIWLNPAMSVAEAHDITDSLERHLEAEFPGTEFLIHVDPEGHVDTDNPLTEADETELLTKDPQ
jgi:ferrous-iron efflux pump FieF